MWEESGLSQDAQPPLHIPWFTVGLCKKQTHNNCLLDESAYQKPTLMGLTKSIVSQVEKDTTVKKSTSVLHKAVAESLDTCEWLDEKLEAN